SGAGMAAAPGAGAIGRTSAPATAGAPSSPAHAFAPQATGAAPAGTEHTGAARHDWYQAAPRQSQLAMDSASRAYLDFASGARPAAGEAPSTASIPPLSATEGAPPLGFAIAQ